MFKCDANYLNFSNYNHIYLYDGISAETVKELRNKIRYINQMNVNSVYSSTLNKDIFIKSNPIMLHINSPGGNVSAGLEAVHAIMESEVPIITVNEGMAASAASIIFVCSNCRISMPNSIFMIHDIAYGVSGKREKIEESVVHTTKLTGVSKKIYKKYTKLTIKEIDKALKKRDNWYSPQECIKLGISDIILPIMQINALDLPKPKLFDFDKGVNHIQLSVQKQAEYNEETQFLIPLKVVESIYNIIDLNNTNTTYGNFKISSKPILLHQSLPELSQGDLQLFSIINVIRSSKIPVYSVIDGSSESMAILVNIVCSKRFISNYSVINLNVNELFNINWEYKKNKIYKSFIMNILEKYTKLPKKILDNVFEKSFTFTPAQCLRYRISDKIIK